MKYEDSNRNIEEGDTTSHATTSKGVPATGVTPNPYALPSQGLLTKSAAPFPHGSRAIAEKQVWSAITFATRQAITASRASKGH